MVELHTPGGEDSVLLHACCAPCSSAIIECMLANHIRPTVFYFNPNIFPEQEYLIRKAENQRYVASLHLDFVDADYDHPAWRGAMKGLEQEPERGRRCLNCFFYRLEVAASYASEHGFTLFTTTLGSSRWKDIHQISDAGRRAAALHPGVTFWEQNWRKGGLSDRRREIIKLYQFYNQQYCGCEFSLKAREEYQRRTLAGL